MAIFPVTLALSLIHIWLQLLLKISGGRVYAPLQSRVGCIVLRSINPVSYTHLAEKYGDVILEMVRAYRKEKGLAEPELL